MDRRWWWLIGGVGLVLVAAGVVAVKAGVTAQVRTVPGWLKSHQPPEGVLNPAVEPVDPKAAWACARPSPMVAPCQGYGAGRRIRKLYPDSLAATPHSLIRAGANVHLEVGD